MKTNKKILFITAVTIFASLFFCVVLVHAFFYTGGDEISLSTPFVSLADIPKLIFPEIFATKNFKIVYPTSYPERLRIPSIKVDANIQYVGVTKMGKMATPNNFTDVGWYKNGTVPGEKGSAVIAGHVDDGLAFPAVFANLGEMKIGDNIYIDTIGGKTLDFKITNIQNYSAEADATEIFTQNDANYLKLITCTGVWLQEQRTHNQRLVITAEQL
jgi:LPXTG-site transpeptidase (sortase) family protein